MALNETLHIEIISSSTTRVEAAMPITPDLYQPFGFLHGGATIAMLESAASRGAEENADFETERPFGVDVHVRHRKSGKEGMLRGVAELDHEETSERTGAVKQFWNVAAYDEEGDVVSDGVIVTKIVTLEYLAAKERERAVSKSAKRV
ncbi:PaaI family thioesterase [Enteroscipio rubneri]|uniref:PaaI family thioesterase n=1 Tax=Enteroscipio rubneri TaxID=2070686 RepID=A0A2K2UEM1_9ACTN|nr:PaaI family thioesterase [Enteroscipio rubneri]PNV68777.1 PaaI family thioesterase [Enteroscipio rubneri]